MVVLVIPRAGHDTDFVICCTSVIRVVPDDRKDVLGNAGDGARPEIKEPERWRKM